MNYQIQGLYIHADVHGTAEPALVFLHSWGGTSRTRRKVTAELEGQFKTVAYDACGWGEVQREETLEKVVLWIFGSNVCSMDGSGKAVFLIR